MSPASYRAAPPRVGDPNVTPRLRATQIEGRSLGGRLLGARSGPIGRLVGPAAGRLVGLVEDPDGLVDLRATLLDEGGPLADLAGREGLVGLLEGLLGLVEQVAHPGRDVAGVVGRRVVRATVRGRRRGVAAEDVDDRGLEGAADADLVAVRDGD